MTIFDAHLSETYKKCENFQRIFDNIYQFVISRGLGEGNLEDEEIAAEDEEDMGVIETYSNYMPSKLKVSFKLYKYKMRSVVLKRFMFTEPYMVISISF